MSVFAEVTQRVYVGGAEIPVRGCAIEENINEAARISFVAEVDFEPAVAGITEGSSVRVEQDADGSIYAINGKVVTTKLERGSSFTTVRVDALGESDIAKQLRFLATYSEPRDVGELIREVWSTYGPAGVSVAAVPNGPRTIKEFNSTYDSLADMMNDMADLTGWVWRIDDGALQWFDPTTTTGPALSQSAGDFSGSSIRLERGISDVKNVAREYAIFTINHELSIAKPNDTCWRFFELDQSTRGLDPADGFELLGGPEISVEFTSPNGNSESLDARIDFQNGLIVLDANKIVPFNSAGLQGLFAAEFKTQKTQWVEREDAGSIAIYGRIEASPLDYDGAATVAAVEDRLDAYLANHAYAAVSFSAGLTRADVRAGERCSISLDDPAFSGSLMVTSVKRTMSGPDLQIDIDAVDIPSTGRPAARRTRNPLTETIRRIERLERLPVNPGSRRGKIARSGNGTV